MLGDDKILSQAEIDELLSRRALKMKPRPPAAKTAGNIKVTELPKSRATMPPTPSPKAAVSPPPPLKKATPQAAPLKAAIPSTPPPKAATPPAPMPKTAVPPELPPEEDPMLELSSETITSPVLSPEVEMPEMPEPAPPATPSTGSASTSYRNYASDEVANLQETVAELARHLVKISSVIQRVDKLEEKVGQIAAFIKLDPESTTLFERRLDEVQKTFETFIKNKPDIRDEFVCSKCQSKKAVAIHVKCTVCGKENWMGWWPETKPKNQDLTDNQQGDNGNQQDNDGSQQDNNGSQPNDSGNP